MLNLDLSSNFDVAGLKDHLTTKEKVVQYRYPTVAISYWNVSYKPEDCPVQRDGTKLPWHARACSRWCDCATLEGLLEMLRRDAAEEAL